MIYLSEINKRKNILDAISRRIPNSYIESGSNLLDSRSPKLIVLYLGLEKMTMTISSESAVVYSFSYYSSDESKMQTLEDIGDKFSITKERARQIIAREVERLKHLPKRDSYVEK